MFFFFGKSPGLLSGLTVDAAGNPLGSCTVYLFNSSTKAFLNSTTSNAVTGAYSFTTTTGINYFLVAYKAGSPDVAGTTVNTITV